MRRTAIAILAALAAVAAHAQTLSFEEAVARAGKTAGTAPITEPLRAEISALRLSRWPSVRAEVLGSASQTFDPFVAGPLEVLQASSVLAFDYSLWGPDPMRARLEALQSMVRRLESSGGLSDAKFAEVLSAFADLYLVQRQMEVVRPIADQSAAEATRSSELLAAGEISNLIASGRNEVALAYKARLLDLESRRIDAAGRLRLLTGVETEPVIVVDLSKLPSRDGSLARVRDDSVDQAIVALEQGVVQTTKVRKGSGFQALLSGFAGFGSGHSDFRDIESSGAFGVYGLRLHLIYPLTGGATDIAVAEARLEQARAAAARDAALQAARARAAEYALRIETTTRRMELLEQSVAIGKAREESLQRLVAAGVRPENDLTRAREERNQREIDLIAVAVDRWKAAQLLARMTLSGGADLTQ